MSDRDLSLEGVHAFPDFRISHHLNRPPAWLVHPLSLAGPVYLFPRHIAPGNDTGPGQSFCCTPVIPHIFRMGQAVRGSRKQRNTSGR
jgi:hypothetical protein